MRPGEGAAVTPPSGWGATGDLARVILADIYGANLPVVRDTAMRVPGIVKGRALIAGTLSRYPLRAYKGADEVASQPSWLSRTDTAQPPQWRMLWTLDDLIFHGRSLWAVQRGGADKRGPILDAVRVPFDEWEIDSDLRIVVQGRPVAAHEVIYFDGPQDALLDIAAEDIQASAAMKRAWTSRVKSPVPLVELHQTEDVQLTPAERKQTVDDWEAARRSNGTALTPFGIDVRVHGQAQTDLYVQGRNAERIDWANYLNLPVALLDGSPATASLTYSVKGDSRSELVDISLSYWTAPIAARLSMDDVTPRGTRIDFDIAWLATPTQPSTANPAADD